MRSRVSACRPLSRPAELRRKSASGVRGAEGGSLRCAGGTLSSIASRAAWWLPEALYRPSRRRCSTRTKPNSMLARWRIIVASKRRPLATQKYDWHLACSSFRCIRRAHLGENRRDTSGAPVAEHLTVTGERRRRRGGGVSENRRRRNAAHGRGMVRINGLKWPARNPLAS